MPVLLYITAARTAPFTAFLGFEVNEGEYKVMGMAFNLQGEPIVNTPAEAFNTSQRSGMDVLVLGDYVVEKPAAR